MEGGTEAADRPAAILADGVHGKIVASSNRDRKIKD